MHSRFTRDEVTRRLDDYHCMLLYGILWCSFQETVPRNTAENTVKHRGGGVGSVVANQRGGGETSMVLTTLPKIWEKFIDNSDVRLIENTEPNRPPVSWRNMF